MRKLSLWVVSCALAALVAPCSAQAMPDTEEAQTARLVTVFWGIVGYTRWPDAGEGPLRLCLVGDDRRSSIIRQSVHRLPETAAGVALGRTATVRSLQGEDASGCDIVYVAGSSQERMSGLSFADAPVLTIGEGETTCSAGGMFCLLLRSNEEGEEVIDGFAVNLEAISGSALWVDPQALRLSRRHHQKQEP